MTFKIIYNENDTINLSATVEAETAREAVTVFMIENPNADVVTVEDADD